MRRRVWRGYNESFLTGNDGLGSFTKHYVRTNKIVNANEFSKTGGIRIQEPEPTNLQCFHLHETYVSTFFGQF
jgi:hypothetical protein